MSRLTFSVEAESDVDAVFDFIARAISRGLPPNS